MNVAVKRTCLPKYESAFLTSSQKETLGMSSIFELPSLAEMMVGKSRKSRIVNIFAIKFVFAKKPAEGGPTNSARVIVGLFDPAEQLFVDFLYIRYLHLEGAHSGLC